MAEKILCPKCGAKMNSVVHAGNTVLSCKKCSHQINLGTGKVTQADTTKPGEVAFTNCPSCNARLSYKKNVGVKVLTCPFCEHGWRIQTDTGEALADAVVSTDGHIITSCPQCGGKNRVPGGKGNLLIRCGGCSHEYYLLGTPVTTTKRTTKPKVTPEAKTEVKTTASSTPKQKVQPVPKPSNQEQATSQQSGLFTGIKEFIQTQKENAANEVELVTGNVLNKTIGECFVRALSEFLPEISDYNYIEVNVSKNSCAAFLYWREDGSLRSKLIKRLEYKPYYLNMREFSGWENCYCEIHSSKARKQVRNEINEILLANYSFLYNLEDKRLVIMDHLL